MSKPNLVKQTPLVREDELLRDCTCYFEDPGPREPEESRDNDLEIMAELRKRFPPKKKMHTVWSLKKT